MRYIVITEAGEPYKINEITEEEKKFCDKGYLTIIDTETCKEYYQDKWIDLVVWGK